VSRRPASALILAGGKSSRFGSDKALAIFRGESLLARALRAARAEFAQVAVVAKDPQRYAAIVTESKPFRGALVADGNDSTTPLAGLVAGLAWCPTEVAFAFAVDMPFAVDPALLDALEAALGPGDHDAAAPSRAGQLEPLCALYRRNPALEAGRTLLANNAGPSALLRTLRTAVVEWPDETPFLDADTQAALEALERRP